jgi:hypothetical protein
LPNSLIYDINNFGMAVSLDVPCFFVREVRIIINRYKCVFFTVSLLFIAGAISPPWGHAGMRWDQDGMSGKDNMGAMGGKSIFDGMPTETECRICHDDLDRFPVLEYPNVDLHHNLFGTVIPEPSESTAPDAPGAVLDEVYECVSHGNVKVHMNRDQELVEFVEYGW